MLQALLTFLPVAALLTILPGPATALVVQSAFQGGRAEALRTTAGNSLGILVWALFAAFGLAAVVAASGEAFTLMKLACGAALVYLGAQAIWRSRHNHERPRVPAGPALGPFQSGLATSISNPKLAVFFVALFPQFVPAGSPSSPTPWPWWPSRWRSTWAITRPSRGWWCTRGGWPGGAAWMRWVERVTGGRDGGARSARGLDRRS